jgi:hypothetical protein
MKVYANILFAFVLLSVAPLSSLSQSQSKPAQQEDEKIVVGTSEVLLDAIVKDKKGRPVKDLTASDFEVFEDGVRQQIRSFRLVTLTQAPVLIPRAQQLLTQPLPRRHLTERCRSLRRTDLAQWRWCLIVSRRMRAPELGLRHSIISTRNWQRTSSLAFFQSTFHCKLFRLTPTICN